jgi:hypothetical protein
MTPASKRRPRRNPQHWKEIISAYDARTGSSDAFCAQHGVASASIHYWREKFGTKPAPARRRAASNNPIVPIRIDAPALFELVLPSGFTLRFPTSIDAASLRAVLLALEPQ